MKLSTRGRYGVRLMVDLAIHYGNEPVLLKDIAERQEISEKYLWQLIVPLKSAGLVNSIRGAHGGYKLAKQPSEILLDDIIRILEGQLHIVDCVEKPLTCKRSKTCATRDVWCDISDKITEVLKSISLKDLSNKQINKEEGDNEYNI